MMNLEAFISFQDDFLGYPGAKQQYGQLQLCSLPSQRSLDLMDIEPNLSTDVQDGPQSTDSPKELLPQLSQSSSDYSKDSLKFSRRIAPAYIKLLETKSSKLVQRYFESSYGILFKQAEILEAFVLKAEELKLLSQQAILMVWRSFAKQLSCTQNRKISKVTKKHWNTVFTYSGFWEVLSDQEKFQLEGYFVAKEQYAIEVLYKLWKEVTFFTNRALILTFLFFYKATEDDFKRNIKTFDNYVVLSMFPELFDFCNHKRGVFVDQCCQGCKVCQSKSINESVLVTIQKARLFAESFNPSSFISTPGMSLEESLNPLSVFEFLATIDKEFQR